MSLKNHPLILELSRVLVRYNDDEDYGDWIYFSPKRPKGKRIGQLRYRRNYIESIRWGFYGYGHVENLYKRVAKEYSNALNKWHRKSMREGNLSGFVYARLITTERGPEIHFASSAFFDRWANSKVFIFRDFDGMTTNHQAKEFLEKMAEEFRGMAGLDFYEDVWLNLHPKIINVDFQCVDEEENAWDKAFESLRA